MLALDITCFVPFVNHGAKILKALGDGRRPGVWTGNRIAERQQHFGDAAHADAANTDKMYALKIAKGNHHGVAPRRFVCTPATVSTRSTMSRAAFGLPSERARDDSCSISCGWSRREKISFARLSAVSSGSAINLAAFAFTISCALRS